MAGAMSPTFHRSRKASACMGFALTRMPCHLTRRSISPSIFRTDDRGRGWIITSLFARAPKLPLSRQKGLDVFELGRVLGQTFDCDPGNRGEGSRTREVMGKGV